MSLRDVRAEAIHAWEIALRDNRCPNPEWMARTVATIAEGLGIKLNRPALADDPAADYSRPPQAGDTATGAAAVRAAIRHTPTATEPPKALPPPPWHTSTLTTP
jgi:hypothetical protein